jgi:hypothetical protein
VAAIGHEFKVNHDDFYSNLIVVPEEVESHECMNILNFFGFPCSVEEDNLCRQIVKKEMGFAKEDEYPLFILESSQPGIPEADLTSNQQILSFLRENNFIGDHKAHSAAET